MSKPKFKPGTVIAYFDASHAHYLYTLRYVSDNIIFLNKTPVQSYCKRQGMVERSTYGSEIISWRSCTEIGMDLRCRQRIICATIHGPSLVYRDNISVIVNLFLLSIILEKNPNDITYYKVREAVTAVVLCIYHVSIQMNISDLITNPLGPINHYPLMIKFTV